MKTTSTFLIAFLMSSVLSFAQQAHMPPLVSVSGLGEVKVVPDQMTFTVGVDVREKTLEEARKNADNRTAALINALKKSGVAAKDIQTTHLSVYPMYNNEYGQTTPHSYNANRIISVVLHKIDQYDEVMTNLYKAGANRLDGLSFQSTQLAKYQEEARKKAIQNAKAKAQSLATEAGAKLGRVYNITEGGTPTPLPRMNRMASMEMSADAGGPTVAAGQIVVSSHIDVSYLLE